MKVSEVIQLIEQKTGKKVVLEKNNAKIEQAEKDLNLAKQKLSQYQNKRQNSIHPFDPQKKMSDYVQTLKGYVSHYQKELDKLTTKENSMSNLDWGKTTEERNKNLDKYNSLKTDKQKQDFCKSLKSK